MAMATKKASAKRTTTKQHSASARPAPRKAAKAKAAIVDPVGRFMRDHWGELGKDYRLEY
jgi:hypothetical protein